VAGVAPTADAWPDIRTARAGRPAPRAQRARWRTADHPPPTRAGPLLHRHRPQRRRATRRRRPTTASRGSYVQPTLLADVNNNMTVAQEEIFGPVSSLSPTMTRTRPSDSPTIRSTAWPVRCGQRTRSKVSTSPDISAPECSAINTFWPDPTAPHGGFKQSGIGREYGKAGLETYVEVKAVHGG
jgi:Aldehyde dehydrogenase family